MSYYPPPASSYAGSNGRRTPGEQYLSDPFDDPYHRSSSRQSNAGPRSLSRSRSPTPSNVGGQRYLLSGSRQPTPFYAGEDQYHVTSHHAPQPLPPLPRQQPQQSDHLRTQQARYHDSNPSSPPQAGALLDNMSSYSLSDTLRENGSGSHEGYDGYEKHEDILPVNHNGRSRSEHSREYSRSPSATHRGGSPSLSRRETTSEAWSRRQKINPRRALTRRVQLTKGNFITEYAVPTAVRNANESSGLVGGPTEFSHMRYTAACVDPDDFTAANGYTLRTVNYGRETDLLVCITAYNEDKILLSRTLHGLMLNIRDMVKGKFSEFRKKAEHAGIEGGKVGEAWKRVVVCLVFDGLAPADKAALDVLATIGLYQDGVMKKDVDGKKTVAHIFEYTTALSMSSKPALVEPQPNDPNNLVPVQMIFCLKQNNAKKINSHRWLFNALGKQLKPDVVCLLDAGTKPGKRSIYYLWEAFHHNKNLGGACGEIHVMLGKNGRKLLNPLVAAQNFEYKVSNVLDKPTESAFGYVAVLPGAFSAYRYRAIQGRPLGQYFKGDHTLAAKLGPNGTDGMGIWEKNMFLAEDRILCFELVAKANEKWVLGYVKPALGETDVPESAAELIGQRRRWLNGSFAAGVYALYHFPRIYRSDHSIFRLVFLHIQALYNIVNLFMSWFAVANFFLTFDIIITIVASSLRNPNTILGASPIEKQCWSGSFLQDDTNQSTDWLSTINWVFKVIYLAVLSLQIILALGNRPKAERTIYSASIAIYAFFAFYLIANTIILTIKAFCPLASALSAAGGNPFSVLLGGTYGPIFAGIASTFGIYVISGFLYLDPWHIFHSMPQYLLIAPAFTNILNVYAFCNLHDVSWGTKGSDKVDTLPSATSKKDGKTEDIVEVQAIVQEHIDLNFRETVMRAVAPFDEIEEVEKPSADDQNKTFRTRFISVWLLMNGILSLTIGRLGTPSQTLFFVALLAVTFFLASVRFSGFIWYLLGEAVFRFARLCSRTLRRN